MTRNLATWMTALIVISLLALPGWAAAQQPKSSASPYTLIDLGTFGGPQSTIAGPSVQLLNSQGIVGGVADTTIPDADYPNFNPSIGNGAPDPFIQHAFLWKQGVLTDLGALPGNNSSFVNGVNAQGDAVGTSEVGPIDPLAGWPEGRAILWTHGRLINLGTLGGNESTGLGMNDRGQVVGIAANTIPDKFSFVGWGTETRAFFWSNGQLRDTGTLGGPDAFPQAVTDQGQITGFSFTSAIPNADTGIPTIDPFLWQDGHMQDLGTLGGTLGGPSAINSRGEVAGQSDLAGDVYFHPFLWNRGKLIDLGTFGGNFGTTSWLNDAGHVAGWATPPGDATLHAALWVNGAKIDLGTLPGQPCSFATTVNTRDQVVGGSCAGAGDGWLWDHGTLRDLNSLVAPSAVHLSQAQFINDRGEIACYGVLPNGNVHAVLLVPAGLAASEGLTSNTPALGAAGPAMATQGRPVSCSIKDLVRARPIQRMRHWVC